MTNARVISDMKAPQVAKAWVNFQGTGTVTKRSGYNVTSITDYGVGDYAVNFTNGFASSDDYTACVTQSAETGTEAIPVVHQSQVATSSTGSAFRFKVSQGNRYSNSFDPVNVYVIVFGND